MLSIRTYAARALACCIIATFHGYDKVYICMHVVYRVPLEYIHIHTLLYKLIALFSCIVSTQSHEYPHGLVYRLTECVGWDARGTQHDHQDPGELLVVSSDILLFR